METVRKKSRKRQAILDVMRASYEHPSAETVYSALKPDYPELSLGTVYRNLTVLRDEGLIICVGTVAGQERYDARTAPHAHFACTRCRRVIDLELPDTVTPLYGEIERSTGCRPAGHSVIVSGLCAGCRE